MVIIAGIGPNLTGSLVLYYGHVGYSSGIVRIGQLDGNVDLIADQAGDFTAAS